MVVSERDYAKLLDIEQIKNLRVLYSHYLDSADVDNLVSLFTEDAVCDFGRGIWRGREELRRNFIEVHQHFDTNNKGSYPYLHAVTNHWVEITGEDSAEGRCYLLDYVTADPAKSPLLLLGVYADEYRKTEAGWRISRSRIDFVWPDRDVAGGAPGRGMGLPER